MSLQVDIPVVYPTQQSFAQVSSETHDLPYTFTRPSRTSLFSSFLPFNSVGANSPYALKVCARSLRCNEYKRLSYDQPLGRAYLLLSSTYLLHTCTHGVRSKSRPHGGRFAWVSHVYQPTVGCFYHSNNKVSLYVRVVDPKLVLSLP